MNARLEFAKMRDKVGASCGTHTPSGEKWGEPTHLKASEKSMKLEDCRKAKKLTEDAD
jgi:hypothetical protein